MKLLILDGNSVINRAFFGVKPLTTREGLYTHAIYGFLNILEKMEKEEQPEAIAVAFDLHGPTFRHLKYDLQGQPPRYAGGTGHADAGDEGCAPGHEHSHLRMPGLGSR